MNSLIKANNEKNQRLVSVSSARRSLELDFFTEASNKYRSYLMGEFAFNPYENESLTEMIKRDFIDLAQDPEDGIIPKQTKLKIDKRNLGQKEIKQLQREIDLYFSRLDNIIQLGGYLAAAIEPVFPQNLPTFIANYDNLNVNGVNERDRDRNMFMVAAWGDLFNYFSDVKVNKEYYFQPTQTNELVVFKQTVMFEIGGETFRKYLHLKPYVIHDFLNNKNIMVGEDGTAWYYIQSEIDSNQIANDDILSLYISDVPESMDLGEVFENAGITKNATLQPQYFLGGSVMKENDDTAQDTSIKIPMFSVADGKIRRFMAKPINTEAINNTPSYKVEIQAHIAGLFSLAGGNISVLYGYSNKRLGVDLPVGINESVTPELEKLYNELSPEGKVNFVGNRYMYNKVSNSGRYLSLIDAQKAYIMSIILQSNLDKKLPQKNYANQPSIVKDVLNDSTKAGQDLIKALNDNDMPIPEFYRNMLGITQWQAGMPIYYQKLPEEVRDVPAEPNADMAELIAQYS
tara:strand:+ start:939 stop:2486 length:1548 start_codon:yes stop_codon:yes gene_type:complete